MRLKILYPIVVLGSISALNWILYARAFEREGIAKLSMQSAAAFLAPFLTFLALAAIYAYFHEKSGIRMPFKDAVFRVALASTPLAINGMALLTLAYFTGNWTEYVLSPFAALLMAGVIVYESAGPGVVTPEGEYLHLLMRLLIDYGAAWIAFFVLYAHLARMGKRRASLVFTALVFTYVIALLGHYLVAIGISFILLLIYKIREVKTEVRVRILNFICQNPGIHFRRLARQMSINRGTLHYHLQVLERFGMIRSEKTGRFRVYFPNSECSHETYPGETAGRILSYLSKVGEASAKEIAAALNLSPSTVSYHLRNLSREGLVTLHRRGREVRVRLNHSTYH
ncbi:MAG: winged helix-turn-helix transcriptional regulator [Euryarchaeota archaeon]|nr:winged helix-turn-helix transcriptional regulator [Euryarchaeota archaeon]